MSLYARAQTPESNNKQSLPTTLLLGSPTRPRANYTVSDHTPPPPFLFGEGHNNSPHEFILAVLLTFLFEFQIQQFAHAFHCHFVVVVGKGSEGIFEDVGRMRQVDERQHALIHAVTVVHPAAQHRVLYTFHKFRFYDRIH